MDITKDNIEKIYKALCFWLKVEDIVIGNSNEIFAASKTNKAGARIIHSIRFQGQSGDFISWPKYIHKTISSAADINIQSWISIEKFAYWFRANEFFTTRSIIKKIMQVLMKYSLYVGSNTIPKVSCLEELVLNYDLYNPAKTRNFSEK